MSENIAAFFDMDRTVIACNSAARYARYLHKRGLATWKDLARTAGWLLQNHFAGIDAETVIERVVSEMEGEEESVVVEHCRECFELDLSSFIFDAARRSIADHQARGHRAVLLTAATNYIAEPLASRLGFDGCLATTLEVDDGRFTGVVVTPVCYGAGKIHWAEVWSRENDVDLDRSFFYSDSFSDLPMLQRVGHAVVVNPDPRLKRHARRHKIPIERWRA